MRLSFGIREIMKEYEDVLSENVKKKLRDYEVLQGIINKFKACGFKEDEIDLIPCRDHSIQFEAEKNGIYLEIEVFDKND